VNPAAARFRKDLLVTAIMRVAYNRIGKAGSSFILGILASLSKKNGFHLENHDDYGPSKEVLARELRNLPNNTVYVNHAGFLQPEGGLIWLNVVREPIDRWSSLFYYGVDPALRGSRATKELRDRQADTRCGCARLEFDDCINLLYHHNCSMKVPSQIKSFCEPGEDCSRELATTHVDESYLLVGLTEELTLTAKMLENLLPGMFNGATSLSPPHRATSLTNSLTNTSLNGAISTRSRGQIAQKAANYVEEKRFYEDMRRRFFHRASVLGLL